MALFACVYPSPVGALTLCADDAALVSLSFGAHIPAHAEVCETALLADAKRQLDAYFQGKLSSFSLPLDARGTLFQTRVWAALREIPYGQVRTYAGIAARIGSPKAVRAVGQANHVNPLPIFIPCHRVVRTGGALGGYAGGEAVKRFLLTLEGVRL